MRARGFATRSRISGYARAWLEQFVEQFRDGIRSRRHDGVENRACRSLERRFKRARLGRFKPLADFEWDCAEGDQIAGWSSAPRRMLVLVGAQACGTAHGQWSGEGAIAADSCLHGHSSLFTTTTNLLLNLNGQETARGLDRRLRHYTRPQLLCIDEIGCLARCPRRRPPQNHGRQLSPARGRTPSERPTRFGRQSSPGVPTRNSVPIVAVEVTMHELAVPFAACFVVRQRVRLQDRSTPGTPPPSTLDDRDVANVGRHSLPADAGLELRGPRATEFTAHRLNHKWLTGSRPRPFIVNRCVAEHLETPSFMRATAQRVQRPRPPFVKLGATS